MPGRSRRPPNLWCSEPAGTCLRHLPFLVGIYERRNNTRSMLFVSTIDPPIAFSIIQRAQSSSEFLYSSTMLDNISTLGSLQNFPGDAQPWPPGGKYYFSFYFHPWQIGQSFCFQTEITLSFSAGLCVRSCLFIVRIVFIAGSTLNEHKRIGIFLDKLNVYIIQ